MFKDKPDKRLLIGIAISALCLYLLFRKIDFDKMAAAFKAMDYRYLVPALALTFASYYLRAVRWKFLLEPLKKTRMSNLFPSTLIGYMANNLLPARLGELVRAYSLGKKEGIDTGAVFASLVVDRLCDGFTILLVLAISFFTVRLPAGMEGVEGALVAGGWATFALYVAVVVFLVLLRARTDWTVSLATRLVAPFSASLAAKCAGALASFISGIRFPFGAWGLGGTVASSIAVWATAIWPVDLLVRSFGVELPPTGAMFIMVFLVFAVMVPASPGFVGTHHIACVTALSAFGVVGEKALSIAIVVHAMGFVPVTAAGLYCLWRDKLSIKSISENYQTGAPA